MLLLRGFYESCLLYCGSTNAVLLDPFIDLGIRWTSILRYVAFPCCGDVGVQAVL